MRPVARAARHARQQRVGALDVLDRDDIAVDHDHGLPDVERAQRAQQLEALADVGLRAFVGLGARQNAFGHQQIGRDVPDADHAEAVHLDDPADAGEQMIVAAAKGGDDARRDAQGAEIEPDLRQAPAAPARR